MSVYCRRLTDGAEKTASATVPFTKLPYGWNLRSRLDVGCRNGGYDQINGEIDLFQVRDTLTVGLEAYDAVYNDAIPEPATMLLLGLGGVTLFRRRR